MRQQPPNREIVSYSSSFSFRAVRAGGRGEAVRARVGPHPQRWAFRVRVWRCSSPLFVYFLLTGVRVLKVFGTFLNGRAVILLTGVRVLRFLGCHLLFFADRRAGFKAFCCLFDDFSNTLCGF